MIPGIGHFTAQDARDERNWDAIGAFVAREPAAFDNDPHTGHVTGSAFVLSPCLKDVLLTHHAKLDRWLQLGGHCDGMRDAAAVALREAQEESGIAGIEMLSRAVFDIDIHEIPARRSEPAHLHYDVRFVMRAPHRDFVRSGESKALAWVPVATLHEVVKAPSVLVVKRKLPMFLKGLGAQV